MGRHCENAVAGCGRAKNDHQNQRRRSLRNDARAGESRSTVLFAEWPSGMNEKLGMPVLSGFCAHV
jgi:hypothetical protein